MTARKFGARKAAAAAIVSAALLSGCTGAGWVAEAPPAAGSQAELSSLQKARNLMFVVDGEGKGVLLGTISTVDATEIGGIAYQPELPDGSWGQPQTIDFSTELRPRASVQLEGPELAVDNPELTAGRLANLEINFGTAGPLRLQVPVYSNEHEDFADAWAEATGA